MADDLATPRALIGAVNTSNGPVLGYPEQGLAVFKGLRYGAPAAGEGRFKPPRRPQPWLEPAEAVG